TLPQREVRVVALRVRPKDFTAARIVGTLYLDAETADLVRLAFNFTPRAYLDPQLEDISIVLDNALWETRFWLPYRQEIEIRRRATWLDRPARPHRPQGAPARRALPVRPGAREPRGRAHPGRRVGVERWRRPARAAAGLELRLRRPAPQRQRRGRRSRRPRRAGGGSVQRSARRRGRAGHRPAPQLVLVPGIRRGLRRLLPRRWGAAHLPPRQRRTRGVERRAGSRIDPLTRRDRGAGKRRLTRQPRPGGDRRRRGAARRASPQRGIRRAPRRALRARDRSGPRGRREQLPPHRGD